MAPLVWHLAHSLALPASVSAWLLPLAVVPCQGAGGCGAVVWQVKQVKVVPPGTERPEAKVAPWQAAQWEKPPVRLGASLAVAPCWVIPGQLAGCRGPFG